MQLLKKNGQKVGTRILEVGALLGNPGSATFNHIYTMHSFLFITARVRFHWRLSVNMGQLHRDGVPSVQDGVPPVHGWGNPQPGMGYSPTG